MLLTRVQRGLRKVEPRRRVQWRRMRSETNGTNCDGVILLRLSGGSWGKRVVEPHWPGVALSPPTSRRDTDIRHFSPQYRLAKDIKRMLSVISCDMERWLANIELCVWDGINVQRGAARGRWWTWRRNGSVIVLRTKNISARKNFQRGRGEERGSGKLVA